MKCEQCGKDLKYDILALFTKYQICKECVVKNHKEACGKWF